MQAIAYRKLGLLYRLCQFHVDKAQIDFFGDRCNITTASDLWCASPQPCVVLLVLPASSCVVPPLPLVLPAGCVGPLVLPVGCVVLIA